MRRYFAGVLALSILFSGCASLRPSQRTWTKEEKLAGAFFVAGRLADAYTTERCLDYPERFYEMNPLLGRHPSDKKLVVYFSLTTAFALTAAHFFPDLRYPILLGGGGLGFGLAYHNKRLLDSR